MAVLAAAAGLAHEAPVALRGPADRLAIGDLGLADVGGDLELADHAVDEHVEVQLAHAGDERLAGLLVVLDAEGRVLLREALERDRELVLVGLRLGLDRDLDDRLGEGHRLEDDRVRGVGQRVAGVRLLEADRGGDVARVDLVDVLAMVRVELDDAPDALLAALARVQDVRAGLEAARVDAEERQLADERVGGDLEREGRERLLVVDRRAAAPRPLAGMHPDDRRDVERRGQVVDDRVEHRLDALVLERRAGEHRHDAVLERARDAGRGGCPRARAPRPRDTWRSGRRRPPRQPRSSPCDGALPRRAGRPGSRRRRPACRGRRGRGSPSSRPGR